MINLKDNGLTINGKHSFYDFGLIMTSKEISTAEAQTRAVEVPGRNGFIDMTEVLTGDVRYKPRTIKTTFYTDKQPLEWSAFVSELRNAYEGQKVKIIFDDDIAFYWLGRTQIEFTNNGRLPLLTLTAVVEPYKYNITTSEDDWLWNPFDFEYGVINEFGHITVNGTETITLIATGKVQTPIITVDSTMNVTLDGSTTVTLNAGQNVVYDFVLDAGEHTIVFSGNGVASVNYVGGSL